MDDAVDVLFRPWRHDPPAFTEDDRVLFLGARAHPDLALAAPAAVVAVQPFAPFAVGLEGTDLRRDDDDGVGEGYAAALVLPSAQREAGLAWLARGMLALRPGGTLVACAASRLGGSRLAPDLAALAGEEPAQETKARCRVVTVRRTARFDEGLASAWSALDAPRPVLDGAFLSRPGLFGWDQVDPGSALLAASLPRRLGRRVADAGCGFGWLAARALEHDVQELHLLEADARALACATKNLGPRAGDVAVRAHWCDATAPWPVKGLDAVVTNPPFHVAGRTDATVGQAFLVRAWEALAPHGRLYVVANRHLPYEGVLRERFGGFETLADRDGFKVLTAKR